MSSRSSLSDDEIAHLGRLCRIRLPADELARFRTDLERIIAMIEEMRAVATDTVEPLAHPLELTQRLRADEVTEDVDRERYQAVAPAVRDGFYLVPRVIE